MLPVPEGLAGLRADVGLSRLLGLSRAKTGALLESGAVIQDGETLKKSDQLAAGNLLEIDIPEPTGYVPEATRVDNLGILYADDDLVVVDKPAGVAAHTGPGWEGPTVVGALRAAGIRVSTSGPVEREGIVHRLDAGTSGAMVVAKSELAYGKLKNEFRYHRVEKIYTALATGKVKPPVGTIDAPIGRAPGREFKMAVVSGGKPAVTHYDIIEELPGATLLKVQLETGRTHQIRVHLAAIGHPLVGDTEYGADRKTAARLGLERQWLHASRLAFKHPRTGLEVAVQAPLPADLATAVELLRQ
nr:RluA family pseudouridine synthase [Mobiluncus curtisii]